MMLCWMRRGSRVGTRSARPSGYAKPSRFAHRLALRLRVLLHHHRRQLPRHAHEVVRIRQVRFAGRVDPLNGLVGQLDVERGQVVLQLLFGSSAR